MPKATIYYFSVTGNSELAVEVISAGLRKANWEVEQKNIRLANADQEAQNLASADFIGFVFPIFAFRAAIPMEKFISSLPTLGKPKPVFFIATFAGYLDRAFMRLNDVLLPRNYVPVITSTLQCEDSWTLIRSPGWIYDEGWPERSGITKLREFSEKKLPEAWKISQTNPESSVRWVPYNPLSAIAAMFPIAIQKGKSFPIFVRKSRCTRCGACANQCPTGRIKMNPTPTASGNCVGCYGCVNSCPVDAIDTWFTNGKLRYRGPKIREKVEIDSI